MVEPICELACWQISITRYDAFVDCSGFQGEQVERMMTVIMRQRDYLSRLVERMRIRRFPPNDPVYMAALGAMEKASNLCVVLAKCRPKVEESDLMERKPWAG